MSQLNRGAVLSVSAPKSSFTFVGVVKEHFISDQRRPTPNVDHLMVEVMSDPFFPQGSGETLVGKQIKVFLEQKGTNSSSTDYALLANSVVGLIQGYEIRPPIEQNHICAFEKGVYDSTSRSIRAEYVKVGASPSTRVEGRAITYVDQWAAVLPARVTGTDVKQTVAILNIKETVRFADFREIEALIDEVKHLNVTPKGTPIGHPAFLVLSRRLPSSKAEDLSVFYADDKTRLASLVVMTPRLEQVGGRDNYVPMTTKMAIDRVDVYHKQLVLDQPGWYHEFIPVLALPVGKNIRPKANSQTPTFDRHLSYQVNDKDPTTGEIVAAGFGFAKSVVMAQCSARTGSWIASFATPVSSLPTLVPPFELVTPETHPGHKAACLAEINRLVEVRKEQIQRRVGERRLRSDAARPQRGIGGSSQPVTTGWGNTPPVPAPQPTYQSRRENSPLVV